MPARGFEPLSLTARGPKPRVFANFTTPAKKSHHDDFLFQIQIEFFPRFLFAKTNQFNDIAGSRSAGINDIIGVFFRYFSAVDLPAFQPAIFYQPARRKFSSLDFLPRNQF